MLKGRAQNVRIQNHSHILSRLVMYVLFNLILYYLLTTTDLVH